MPSREMPSVIDLSAGIRGLHQIPDYAKILMLVAIERGVWEYPAVQMIGAL